MVQEQLTQNMCFYILLKPCIPRLCNGSTSDSGSDCGGSNPPWGTTKRTDQESVFFSAPSNIGLVHRPLKAERRVRLPLELFFSAINSHQTEIYLFTTPERVEPRNERRPTGGKASNLLAKPAVLS